MSDVNFFRTRRGRVLRQQIDLLAAHLGRPITVLDLGGRPGDWGNIGMDNIASVHVLNNERTELAGSSADRRFSFEVGDACDLSAFTDKSVDLVHSNLVIEHVGLWPDQHAMAEEAIRVGLSGWIQTPAFEFRIEPHHGLPFTHWLGQPIRRALLRAAPGFRHTNVDDRRTHVDRTNMLSHAEMQTLFPGCSLYVERFALMPKSFVARWMPERGL